jgi:PDZ domain-containing protein
VGVEPRPEVDKNAVPPAPNNPHRRLSRRGWTVLASFILVVALALTGGFVRVPYVVVGPGPTYDTLSAVNGTPIVEISGTQTYPTDGQLRMTTVSVEQDITLFSALGRWMNSRYSIAPREDFIPPGKSEQDVELDNKRMFDESQSNAEVAALRLLKKPIVVIAREITKGSPADQILQPGDRLVVVNGMEIKAPENVRTALQGTAPGKPVTITFQHGKQPQQTASVTLAKASDFTKGDNRTEGFLGLAASERADVDFKTTIHLQDVGGPSAGLMFALAIVDRLTPGEMEHGQPFAGTGTIDPQGNVGSIGGIPFKMVAAREAGANTFLVPADNCVEARSQAPDGLRLVKVDTLEHAVQALDDLHNNRPVPGC